MATGDDSEKDFGKLFVEVFRERARQQQDDNVDIDMTDVLASLMKEKFGKPSSSNSIENEKHEELTFQMKRPCFPYQDLVLDKFWMQDLPWPIRKKVCCEKCLIYLLLQVGVQPMLFSNTEYTINLFPFYASTI